MSAVLTGVSAGASLIGGLQQRAALKSQAKAAEFQARAERLRGAQIAAIRRDEFNEAVAAIDTIRVERGLSLDSPGADAIRAQTKSAARLNEQTEVLSSRFRETDLRNEAAARRRAATAALIGGVTSAGSTIASFAAGKP